MIGHQGNRGRIKQNPGRRTAE